MKNTPYGTPDLYLRTSGIEPWKVILRQIEIVQRDAYVLVTGSSKITPQAAPSSILDLPPLDLYAKSMTAKNALRVNNNK